ncbi:MAG: hypothetical protein HZB16_05725 [Armatimonadetes bacterium]|nr:hypothetical protein [Armatimonadota bacterium]
MGFMYAPATIDSWQQGLADTDRHWKDGYSAKSLCDAWHDADGFPDKVARVLRTEPRFADLAMLLGIPEHKVSLVGHGKPSQNDLWVLARTPRELVSIAVEGKVAEDFGPTVAKWSTGASDGKTVRLAMLADLLALPNPVPGDLRYQLLHRTASAILEAQRFGAPCALMVVHSFSAEHAHLGDYQAFAAQLGAAKCGTDDIAHIGVRGGVDLYLGWVAP